MRKSEKKSAPGARSKADVRQILKEYYRKKREINVEEIEEENNSAVPEVQHANAVDYERSTRESAEEKIRELEAAKKFGGGVLVGAANVFSFFKPGNPVSKPVADVGKVLQGEKDQSSLTGLAKQASESINLVIGEDSDSASKPTCVKAISRCLGLR